MVRLTEVVDSVPQYAAIVKHCPNLLRAILSIGARGYSCATLYRTLCTTRCSACSFFGDHLYLIDCRRVCYMCFARRRQSHSPWFSIQTFDVFGHVATAQETLTNRSPQGATGIYTQLQRRLCTVDLNRLEHFSLSTDPPLSFQYLISSQHESQARRRGNQRTEAPA